MNRKLPRLRKPGKPGKPGAKLLHKAETNTLGVRHPGALAVVRGKVTIRELEVPFHQSA